MDPAQVAQPSPPPPTTAPSASNTSRPAAPRRISAGWRRSGSCESGGAASERARPVRTPAAAGDWRQSVCGQIEIGPGGMCAPLPRPCLDGDAAILVAARAIAGENPHRRPWHRSARRASSKRSNSPRTPVIRVENGREAGIGPRNPRVAPAPPPARRRADRARHATDRVCAHHSSRCHRRRRCDRRHRPARARPLPECPRRSPAPSRARRQIARYSVAGVTKSSVFSSITR